MKKPLKFFGRELSNTGSHWQVELAQGATVVVWQQLAYPKRRKTGEEPALWTWFAKIVGSKPDNDIVVVRGRSPAEALRNLEKATLNHVRDFVRVFGDALRQIGTEIMRVVHSEDFHKSKKK